MKYLVYLVIAAALAGGAFYVRGMMRRNAENTVINGAPTSAQYASHLAAVYPPSGGKHTYAKVEDIANAGREILGKETLAEWLKPLHEGGWTFKGCSESTLPGPGRSAVMEFEKDGKRVVLFAQVYKAIPDLAEYKGKAMTLEAKAPIVDARMYWNGGGVVYYATSDQPGAVEALATTFGWPAPSGTW